VLRSSPTAPDVEHRVAELPDDFISRRTGERWVVIGPTGLFLIATSTGNAHLLAEQTAIDAHLLRTRLAEVLDLVPFVDPVVCSTEPSESSTCAVVEPRMLTTLLLGGPDVIPESELQLLRHHVPAVLTAMETGGGWV
jgi:hypothetical protein